MADLQKILAEMHINEMENYEKCLAILQHHKMPYHTYNKTETREIRAIFKGVVKDLNPAEIAEELKEKGFHPRVKNQIAHQCQSYLIVPGTEHRSQVRIPKEKEAHRTLLQLSKCSQLPRRSCV
ncbi:hypothetical protein JTB14_032609 [Gonioctena quinquepunctata]|nr:hypothetical protein JTB14_032609 [Gonioctena quinquepunctata]